MPEPSRRGNRPSLICLGLALLLPLVAALAFAQNEVGVDPEGLSTPLCLSDPHTLC